jgi:hypothetical protein
MTREDAEKFADQWAGFWNAGDIESVLAHFSDETIFTSPSAVEFAGTATVRGKAALRDYWTSALARIGALHFTVDHVLWDPERRELAIVYTARMAGKARRVSENLRFGTAGQIVAAEVFHGVAVQS